MNCIKSLLIKRGIVIIPFFIYLMACNNEETKENKSDKSDKTNRFRIETYQSDTISGNSVSSYRWGYDIYVDGRLYIRQPHIPAVNGIIGFKSEEDAMKTAELMIYKIEKNILPPSVDISELDSLGVSY